MSHTHAHTITQYYRYDRVARGEVTLTIESVNGGIIESIRGTVRLMYAHRRLHYPNAHNYRHHVMGEDGCPTCDMHDQS